MTADLRPRAGAVAIDDGDAIARSARPVIDLELRGLGVKIAARLQGHTPLRRIGQFFKALDLEPVSDQKLLRHFSQVLAERTVWRYHWSTHISGFLSAHIAQFFVFACHYRRSQPQLAAIIHSTVR